MKLTISAETVQKQILRYLYETKDYGILYDSTSDKPLLGYLNLDYVGDTTDMKFTSGILYTLNKEPVSWALKKQSNVATSMVTAEFYAVEECVKKSL